MKGRELDDNERLNIDIATRVLGYEVEECEPSWYPRTVFLFRRPGADPRWIEYSFDTNSCNACMNRDQQDKNSYSAPPLPGYCYSIAAAWEVVSAMQDTPHYATFNRLLANVRDLWDKDEEHAATQICKCALEALGYRRFASAEDSGVSHVAINDSGR